LDKPGHCGVNSSFSPLIYEFKDHSEAINVQKIKIVLIESPNAVFVFYLFFRLCFLLTR